MFESLKLTIDRDNIDINPNDFGVKCSFDILGVGDGKLSHVSVFLVNLLVKNRIFLDFELKL